MKRKLSVVVLLLGLIAGALMSGCNKQESSQQPPMNETNAPAAPSTNAAPAAP
jgi:hypothetical protein